MECPSPRLDNKPSFLVFIVILLHLFVSLTTYFFSSNGLVWHITPIVLFWVACGPCGKFSHRSSGHEASSFLVSAEIPILRR